MGMFSSDATHNDNSYVKIGLVKVKLMNLELMRNLYVWLLNCSTYPTKDPMCWASCALVLVHFTQWNTLHNTPDFLLRTCSLRISVVLKPTSTP